MTLDPTTGFSVLLPVYGGDDPAFLVRAFDSVTVEQTLPPSEVVVVRDGPVGADMQRVLSSLPGRTDVPVQIVVSEENRGLAHALELGLRSCSREIVARMDADDISVPARFAVQIPLVRDGCDLVGSAIQEFSVESEPGIVRVPPLTGDEIDRASRFVSPFNHPSVVYRRAAVAAAGGYEDLPLMEDYWLFSRMLALGARTRNVREPLVLYRVGAGAYARRGGVGMLRSEMRLQWRLRLAGITTVPQFLRNVVVRGAYRLVPQGARRGAYRSVVRATAKRRGASGT